MKSFANGGSSLTGLEAISNGVSPFHQPAGRNARRTLVAMSIILGTIVAGVSWLARATHAVPYQSGVPSVISQVAHAALGSSAVGHVAFVLVQLATCLILWTGANTPFNGFPYLTSSTTYQAILLPANYKPGTFEKTPQTTGAFKLVSYTPGVGAKYDADLRTHDQPGQSRVKVVIRPVRVNAVDMRG